MLLSDLAALILFPYEGIDNSRSQIIVEFSQGLGPLYPLPRQCDEERGSVAPARFRATILHQL
jgi:hypothetical protein